MSEANIQEKSDNPQPDTLLRVGLSVIPVGADKRPTVRWTEYQTRLPNPGELPYNGRHALILGKVSGNLEAIDIDAKHDPTILDRYQDALGEFWPEIYPKLVIQRTPSGGCHFIYRCPLIEGNQKLASSSSRESLIETRGEGGYIVLYPSPGYELCSERTIFEIETITPDERERLFDAARSLNEYWEPVKAPQSKAFTQQLDGLPPWTDYDQRADVTSLLQSHGWQFLKSVGENDHYCRPGKKGSTSATWKESLRLFYCFTSSTCLEPSKAYSPSALFAKLECNGDFAQAAQRLYSMGYGDRGKRQEKTRQPADALNDTPIEEVWEEILLKEEPPPDKPLITINNIPVVIAGEHTLIVGKKKSRKTLFVVWLISKYPALFFDTEQGRGHVWKVRQKVMQLSGKETPVFYLRGKSPSERREIIYQTVKQWPERPALIVIDGIRDLLSNINDPDQATNLIVWIEGLCREFGVAIVNVLHLNKTDGQARGHIGTELGNKAFMTVELALDEVSGASIVKCESSRDRPFESFAITHDPEGLPIITGMPIKGEVLTDKERRQRLAYVFEDGPLKYGETVDRISQHFNVGERKAKALLSEFRRCGWLVKSGPDRSPDTVYKLMITEGTSGSDHT